MQAREINDKISEANILLAKLEKDIDVHNKLFTEILKLKKELQQLDSKQASAQHQAEKLRESITLFSEKDGDIVRAMDKLTERIVTIDREVYGNKAIDPDDVSWLNPRKIPSGSSGK